VFLPSAEWQTRKVCDGVVMLRCFGDDVCACVSRVISQVSDGGDAANTMSRHGRRLRDTAVDYLISRNLDVINEMVSRSFSESTASTVMKDHYTFAIRYAVGADESLGTHSDRSAFTLNVCLAASCEGSEVYFVNDDRKSYPRHCIGCPWHVTRLNVRVSCRGGDGGQTRAWVGAAASRRDQARNKAAEVWNQRKFGCLAVRVTFM
jgi:hypothetical protein